MDPRSHDIGTNTLKFCVCVCVWGGGGGQGEGGGGGWWKGEIPYFSYTKLCVAAWIGYGFPRSPGYN